MDRSVNKDKSKVRHAKKKSATPTRRRETLKRWVQRGQYAVEMDVEVVYPVDDPSEPCLEPATIRQLAEVARRAEQGDVAYLRRVGRVFRLVAP